MWRLLRTSGYSYPRVTTIQIDIHRAGENPINMTHTLSTSVHIRPAYASYGQSPYVTTFHESSTDLFGSHCFREKDSRHNPRIHTQFLSQANQWRSKLKPSFCRWQATRFTGPISPVYDQYVQYFFAGANPSILNWHRRRLQPWRCQIFTYTPQPSQPVVSTFHLRASPGLQFNHELPKILKFGFKKLMTATWSFNHSAIYHNLHLCLAITNDLPLAIGGHKGINSTPIT
jgi:hypothetical protein